MHNQFSKPNTLFHRKKRAAKKERSIFRNCNDIANEAIKKASSFLFWKSNPNKVEIRGKNIDGFKCVFGPFFREWRIKINWLWKIDLLFWIHEVFSSSFFLWDLIGETKVKWRKRFSRENCDGLVSHLWRVSIHWWELINVRDSFVRDEMLKLGLESIDCYGWWFVDYFHAQRQRR